ncbi:MAG: DNA polymerase III subunit [Paludibacteraceae bacterium]|nr:DNA polymerase III subunit [Paludibacteraceae bacterium]
MRFRDIIGQEDVKRQLRLSVQNGRIPHAQLFAGKQGVGKLGTAIAYAQYLNCPNRTDDDSCGECPTCKQFERLQHPDLHFAFPIVKDEKTKKEVCDDYMNDFRSLIFQQQYISAADWYQKMEAENKQALIYEKESSEILRKLSLKAFGQGYKVMIIWQPEKMNDVCSNKLLKLIEEPPEKTVLILVSEYPERLLSTIISRTQLIRFNPLSETQIATALTTQGYEALAAQDIAHLAQGSYYTALQLMGENEQNRTFFEDFQTLMRNAWKVGHRKDYAALQELRKWSLQIADKKVGRETQKAFLQFAQRQVRENFIYNFHQPTLNYQTSDEAAFSKNFAVFIHENNVEKIMNELATAERQIAQNGNPKIIFFDLCLQMIVLIKK